MSTLSSNRINRFIALLGIIFNILSIFLNGFNKNLEFGLLSFVCLGICLYTYNHFNKLLNKKQE
jgi:hypothetical protein